MATSATAAAGFAVANLGRHVCKHFFYVSIYGYDSDSDSDSDLLHIVARLLAISNTNSENTSNTTQQYKKIQFNAMSCSVKQWI